MKKVALLVAVLLSCNKSGEYSADHLRALGYKVVACSAEGPEATCFADGASFHCVTTDASGCDSEHHVACERFYVEKPAP